MEKFVRLLDFVADIRQAAIFLVLRDVVRVNGHDDAGQTVADEAAHVFIGPQTAVGANHRVDAPLGCVARHRAQIAMHHRLAADEEQVANVILDGNVNDLLCLVERDTFAGLGIKLGARKTAETAVCVADVRDGKLEVARAAVVENFAHEFEHALFGPLDRLGKIRRDRSRRNGFGSRQIRRS